MKIKRHYTAQFYWQKLSGRCIANRASPQKRKGPSPILRRISYPPRSGIREHFIIQVTVASEQTRADNATLRENATPMSERAGDRQDASYTHTHTYKRIRIEVAAALLPFLGPFRFISSLGYSFFPLVSAIKLTPSTFPLVGGTKVGFSTYPR